VIAYHYDIPPFRSGFVGVDVFFVISGFLITRIIWTEVQAGTFSLASFYQRRARRILPAALVMLLVVLAGATLVLLPQGNVSLAQQALAVVTFSSNFLFWSQQGYFDSTSITKPLLHTWSLAVEEQYYILFPAAAMFAFSFRRPVTLAIFAIVCALSLLLCIIQTKTEQSSAFYLLPARIWELGLGALLAIRAVPELSDRRLSIGACAFGWALLAASANVFTTRTPYPGANALLPCLGATIVIWANPELNKRLLVAMKPMIMVGLWSYSLYLWHWPIISLAHAVLGPPTSYLLKILLLGCCVALSIASYYLVERPARHAKWAIAWRSLAAVGVTVVAASILTIWYAGFPFRFSPQEMRVAGFLTYDYAPVYEARSCFLLPGQRPTELQPSCIAPGPRPNILLWGDSHAAHLIYGLKQALPSATLLRATMAGCLPSEVYGQTPDCATFNRNVLDFVRRQKPDVVVISANWARPIFAPAASASLVATIKNVLNSGSRVVLIGPSPQYDNPLPLIYLSMTHFGIAFANHIEAFVPETNDFLRTQLQNEPNVEYVSLLALMCSNVECPLLISDSPIAWDEGHFTAKGSAWAGSLIVETSRLIRQSLLITPRT
jgi:peptidoglycan/LPS O-acetylase OafA/YrhL